MDCRIREVFLLSIDITPQVTVLIYIGVCTGQVEKRKTFQPSCRGLYNVTELFVKSLNISYVSFCGVLLLRAAGSQHIHMCDRVCGIALLSHALLQSTRRRLPVKNNGLTNKGS
jgi:hypothetical protein